MSVKTLPTLLWPLSHTRHLPSILTTSTKLAKRLGVQKAAQEADVAVTSVKANSTWLVLLCKGLFAIAFFTANVNAAVLPEDRADVLYHRYEGGGVTIDGPSVLVRKEFAEKVSVWGNYYVDMVSSASIDVLTSGSAYSEERTDISQDFFGDMTTLSLNYSQGNDEVRKNRYEGGVITASEVQGDAQRPLTLKAL